MPSIVIVSWNTESKLRICLQSLVKYYPTLTDVIVIDNHSSDNTVTMVREEFPQFQIKPLSENIGFAAANNLGVREVRGDFVLLLNPDTEFEDSESLGRAVQVLKDNDAGAVGVRVKNT
ncbi:MAG: glycosyltransferase, partial [Candidatus Komeilibacteria bacterium]|nr:glycosyltransferase [Candidatus Komeilibacteria bacterium]